MLVGEDSVLRKLPSALDKRQLRMLVAIRYSIEMYDVAYQSILGLLNQIETGDKFQSKTKTLYPLVFTHAWSMVDSANRLEVLLKHMPNIKRGPRFKANLRRIAAFKSLRNPIQHLNKEILNRSKDVDVEPIWGSLSWAKIIETDPFKVHVFTLIPGSLEKHSGRPLVNPAGKNFHGKVDHISLSAYGTTVSLSDTYHTIANISKMTEDSLQKAFEGNKQLEKHLPADLLVVAEMVFKEDREGKKRKKDVEDGKEIQL